MVEQLPQAISDPSLTNLAWAIIVVPFITGALLILARGWELKKEFAGEKNSKFSEKLTGSIGVASLVVTLVLSFMIAMRYFTQYVDLEKEEIGSIRDNFDFLPSAEGSFQWGILLNPLSVIMLVLLAVIATAIHFYASEYMHADPAYTRFFGTLNLFTGSMYGFVLASNLFMAFIFWELLGFTSYLLIAFYWPKRSASAAGMKAFLYNKVGDVSFLLGIAMLWSLTYNKLHYATVDYFDLKNFVTSGDLTFADVWLPGLLIFGGAIGKSAQLPLLGWLPEAMEGPTPVSALLHSSTMVKAGLYLTARIFFTFYEVHNFHVTFVEEAFWTANTIAWIGTFTALIGGLIALTATDIKKVLAFSTISQLGYIALALGAGGITASFFHLISHATFKSLLFLSAGAVIHSVHSQEMDDMGGLRKKMPITFAAMTVGLAALAGFPLSSGFWSKDAVLLAIEESEIVGHQFLYWVALFTAAVTAFYSTKLWLLTFFGEPRYDKDHVHPAPTGKRMATALIILASLVVIETVWWMIGVGFGVESFNFEYQLGTLLGAHGGEFSWVRDLPPSLVAFLSGSILAYLVYGNKKLESLTKVSFMVFMHKIAKNRFGLDIAIAWISTNIFLNGVAAGAQYVDKNVIDKFIDDVVVDKVGFGTAEVSDFFDENVIDGAVDFVGDSARSLGRMFRKLQTAQTSWYARLMAFGLAVLLTVYTFAYLNNWFAI